MDGAEFAVVRDRDGNTALIRSAATPTEVAEMVLGAVLRKSMAAWWSKTPEAARLGWRTSPARRSWPLTVKVTRRRGHGTPRGCD